MIFPRHLQQKFTKFDLINLEIFRIDEFFLLRNSQCECISTKIGGKNTCATQ